VQELDVPLQDFSKHLPQREQKDQHPEEQYSKSRQAFLIWHSLFPSLNTPVSELTVYRVAHQMQSLKVHQAQKESHQSQFWKR
jgi:hypothetical protein